MKKEKNDLRENELDLNMDADNAIEKSVEQALGFVDPYKKYMYEIKNLPVLSAEEEHKLAVLYSKTGDTDAAYKLIISNLRLVVKIAMEFHAAWVRNISDLVQEGNIGLMEALKKYDPYRNVRFSSYASFWIKAYIIKFIMDNYSLIRIGKTQAQRKLFFNLNKERNKLAQLGYDFGPKLLAEKLNVKEKEVTDMTQRMSNPVLSLDAPLKDEPTRTHLDNLADNGESIDEKMANEQMESLLKRKLQQFKKSLNYNERYIFENRIYAESPKNLQDIGEALNFSRERARQVEAKVIKKLKVFLKENAPEVSG